MAPDKAHEITMKFTEEAFRTLEGLANERGQSVGDVVSEALALQRWADRERANGNAVAVVRDGKVHPAKLSEPHGDN
jgi:hypothetical protein